VTPKGYPTSPEPHFVWTSIERPPHLLPAVLMMKVVSPPKWLDIQRQRQSGARQ
jgi:hypothetical protein